MQGPCFYINNFRAATIYITNTTNNSIDLYKHVEKGAKCKVRDHDSIEGPVS